MDSLNHQRTPLQPIQCEMCGQLKLIHSLGAQIMRSHAQLELKKNVVHMKVYFAGMSRHLRQAHG